MQNAGPKDYTDQGFGKNTFGSGLSIRLGTLT